MTTLNDVLWGGGKLIAGSPEAPSPVPPPDAELDRFFAAQRLIMNELPANNDERRIEIAEELANLGLNQDRALELVLGE